MGERGLECADVTVGGVLRGVALAVRPGEVVALTAPSGAGKSTLLRAWVRLVELDAGEGRLDGTRCSPSSSRAPRSPRTSACAGC